MPKMLAIQVGLTRPDVEELVDFLRSLSRTIHDCPEIFKCLKQHSHLTYSVERARLNVEALADALDDALKSTI